MKVISVTFQPLFSVIPEIFRNSLGVDPVSGEVYFATLKGYADYKTNDIAIFDFNKTPALQFDIKNKNSFPAGVFFTENFK